MTPRVSRIQIVGAPGSGKTWLGSRLGARTGAPVIELDGIFHTDDWHQRPTDEAIAILRERILAPAWITDGNWTGAGAFELIRAQADVVVYFDLPHVINHAQLFARTVVRAARRQPLWGTNNRESFRRSFLSRESVLLWGLTKFNKYRRRWPSLHAEPAHPSQWIIRIGSRADARRTLDQLTQLMTSEDLPSPNV
ncbi:MAG: hypothetical protein AAGI30_04135 [Planctomycetota bacterium]